MAVDTIIGVPYDVPHLRSMLHDPWDPHADPVHEGGDRLFKIRSADSAGQRSSASILINRMYATRGYSSNGLPDQTTASRVTLVASDDDVTLGTMTVGFDSDAGLHVDELFHQETDGLRRAGRHVCEFTKLAMDSVVRSKRVLASLFHVAYMVAHRIRGIDNVLIEVNPRHVRYYERMLGFVVLGPPRLNRRVNAPAVLLSLDFGHAHRQIAKMGGRPEFAAEDRSLYPFFFSVEEEAGICGRLTLPPPPAAHSREQIHMPVRHSVRGARDH